MTNENPTPNAQAASGSLRSLVQALDKLVDDDNACPPLTLPDSTVAQIQKSFTINPLTASADNNQSYRRSSARGALRIVRNTPA